MQGDTTQTYHISLHTSDVYSYVLESLKTSRYVDLEVRSVEARQLDVKVVMEMGEIPVLVTRVSASFPPGS